MTDRRDAANVHGLDLRVRFDPAETEVDALREKDNIVSWLRRLGYDVVPRGLVRRD